MVVHKGDPPKTEKLDAGIDLVNHIRHDDPMMPVLLQSSQASVGDVAKRLNVGFLKKDSSDTTKSDASGKKSYDKVITADAETSKGVMDIHKVKSTYYLEIPFAMMGKPMLLATKVSSTSDNSDVIAGQMPGEPKLVEWSCDEDKVYLLDGTIRATCDTSESISKGFASGYRYVVISRIVRFQDIAVIISKIQKVIDQNKLGIAERSTNVPVNAYVRINVFSKIIVLVAGRGGCCRSHHGREPQDKG